MLSIAVIEQLSDANVHEPVVKEEFHIQHFGLVPDR